MDIKSLTHTKWNCTYHIVFIPKYRRKVMFGELRADILESGSVSSDHIHMCVKIPPKLSVSEFMGYLKGKSALAIFDKHPEYKQRGNRHFWAKGYYVDTVGRNEEEIKKYIKNQMEADMLET